MKARIAVFGAALLALALAVPISHLHPSPNLRTEVTNQNGVINVHLIPHTHDDVGWLKTVDQYYAGKNESIQHAAVHQIISSAMDALARNPARKFIYVEMAFFWRWWQEQTEARRQQVRGFVQTGQLEFINGGWCMHDEAATHFQSMIDQTTEGHTFIKNNFGVTPTVQWQIDPFGHSSANAELSLQMGLNSLFFMRADHADIDQRQKNKGMEMMWYPSQTMPDLKMFTHILYQGYGPTPGFDWDVENNDEPIQDDIRLGDYNVPSRMTDFLNACNDRAAKYRTSNILMTMGSDFHHRQSEDWFGNLDKLIKYSNMYLNSSINVFYSTPSIYTKAVLAEAAASGVTFPQKSDDFFPYSDGSHAYWTGYFTSRPALKRYERYSMAYLQICKQIEATSTTANASATLREAMGVAQHHDAVSGTEKQHVAFDYAKRIARGVAECETMINKELAASAHLSDSTFVNCHLLNVSVCAQTASKKSGTTTLIIYNSLGLTRQEYVRIPVATATGASVSASGGSVVVSQVVDNTADTVRIGSLEGGAANTGLFTQVFQVSIPARGYAVYTLNFDQQATNPFTEESTKLVDDDFYITNGVVQLDFSGASGKLTSITRQTVKIQVEQDFFQYYSSPGTVDDGQASGAYIFRPNQVSADQITPVAQIIGVVNGPLVQEVRQVFNDNTGGFVVQTIRLYSGHNEAEFEWTVGPISLHNGWGKEVISRFSSNIASNKTFFTDSNGREMQKRTRDYRATWDLSPTEPVAQNYYPVNTAMYLQDVSARLTLVTDRSQGGASLVDGAMEVMVHRRTVKDDSRGVDEPISEPGIDGKGLIVRGSHYLVLSTPSDGPALHKDLVSRTTYPPLVSFSTSSLGSQRLPSPVSFMSKDLPSNVHLLTFQALTQDRTLFLVRLNHLFQVGDGPEASTVSVSLDSLFSNQIKSVTELMLSGNQPVPTRDPTAEDTHIVTLSPMQIRTFHVQF